LQCQQDKQKQDNEVSALKESVDVLKSDIKAANAAKDDAIKQADGAKADAARAKAEADAAKQEQQQLADRANAAETALASLKQQASAFGAMVGFWWQQLRRISAFQQLSAPLRICS
jgi:chromosome segregation ATPase